MIKLIPILSEIKVIGQITPQMVEKEYSNFHFKYHGRELRELIDLLFIKHNLNGWMTFDEMEKLSQNELKNLYFDIKKLTNGDFDILSEIKTIKTNVTPEILINLFHSVYSEERGYIKAKYAIAHGYKCDEDECIEMKKLARELTKEELKSCYLELLQLK